MAKFKLKAQLTGVGSINNAKIFLEDVPGDTNPNATAIGLYPKNINRKEWENKDILIEVNEALDYQLNIHAACGTSWNFVLINSVDGKKILDFGGTTGQDPDQGMNVSVAKGSTNI